MYHRQLGSSVIKVGSDTLFERGQYRYANGTLYILVLQSNLDESSKNLYIARKKDGGSCSIGKPLGITDVAANEIVFDVTDEGEILILYEDSGIDNVNIHKTGNRAFLPAVYFLLLHWQ